MSAGIGNEISRGQNIAGQQLSIASEQQRKASADYDQYKSLISPLISRDTALAAGNRREALAAAMPVLSQLSSGWQGARQNILNTMAPGAARDRALADLATQRYTGMAGAQAGMVQQAPGELSQTGQQVGNYGLQELGASLGSLQGATQSNAQVMQAKIQQQKAMLDFFSSMAGTVAGAATGGMAGGGGFAKMFGGGGGGGTPFSPPGGYVPGGSQVPWGLA